MPDDRQTRQRDLTLVPHIPPKTQLSFLPKNSLVPLHPVVIFSLKHVLSLILLKLV